MVDFEEEKSTGVHPIIVAPVEVFGQKRELIILFWPILGLFWSPVVTLVTFSSILSNFEKNPKNEKRNTKQSYNFLFFFFLIYIFFLNTKHP